MPDRSRGNHGPGARDLASRKQRLRTSVESRLTATAPERFERAGEAICDRVVRGAAWQSASGIAVFVSLSGEVATRFLIDHARREHKTILLPRMLPGRTLEFAIFPGTEFLRQGRHGVFEPDERCPNRELSPDTIVFVPGLAFDREGGRLGRGAGYYDRALAPYLEMRDRPLFVGIGMAEQIVAAVPMGPNDVRMDGFVTDAEVMGAA